MNNSVNAKFALGVSCIVCAAPVVLALIVIIVTLILARRKKWDGVWVARTLATGFCSFAAFSGVTLAMLSGFEVIPPELALILWSLLWVAAVFLCLPLTTAAWRTLLEPTNISRVVRAYCAASLDSMHSKKCFFHSASVFGYTVAWVVVLASYGICYCSHPFELTSWLSRRQDPVYCFSNTMCHQYVLLGSNASRYRVVSHVVTDLGSPLSTSCDVCELRMGDCVGASWSVTGVIRPMNIITEDPRYLSTIFVGNLTPTKRYLFNVSITLADGTSIRGQLTLTALPSTGGSTQILSVGGYNVETSSEHLAPVMTRSDPQVVLWGGDFAFAHNMRRCYRRMDKFCAHSVSLLRTNQGDAMPIVVLASEVEAGGYLRESNLDGYNFLSYFPQGDDSVATTVNTFHQHHIGSFLIIVLDSGAVLPGSQQIAYLSDTIHRGIGSGLRVIVAYHNAVYPAVEDADVGDARSFSNIITSNVTLVLEFHNNAYKRTKPLFRGLVYANGTVFVGDGGAGVASQCLIAQDSRLAMTRGVGTTLVLTLHHSTLQVQAMIKDGAVIDSFSL